MKFPGWFRKEVREHTVGQGVRKLMLTHTQCLEGINPRRHSSQVLGQWFSTFLVLLPFNAIPHVVVTSNCCGIFVYTV